MSFSEENGYTPRSIDGLMYSLRTKINFEFGTNYDVTSFQGTNFYKYFYALAQKMQESEIKTSEIFLKLQQYFVLINDQISRPVNTNLGTVDRFEAEGFKASVKPMILADAGKQNICVDVEKFEDDGSTVLPGYAAVKTAICTLISTLNTGGIITQGDESEAVVISNGQSFDFKYHLPTKIPVILRLTLTTSENNQNVIGQPDTTKQSLFDKINSLYKLGLNFEPQRYFTQLDAPWASEILLEYSEDDGSTWESEVKETNFDELLTFGLDDITLVES